MPGEGLVDVLARGKSYVLSSNRLVADNSRDRRIVSKSAHVLNFDDDADIGSDAGHGSAR